MSTLVSEALGTALVEFLWQGTAVGLLAGLLLTVLQRRSARTRYAVACGALAVLTTLPVATFVHALEGPASTEAAAVVSLLPGATTLQTLPQALSPRTTARLMRLTPQHAQTISNAWLAGVLVLSVRLLVGFFKVQHLARVGTEAASAVWRDALARVLQRDHPRRRVGLVASPRIDVPMVVGLFRPLVVVPVSALTGLSAAQVEAVLAHELAHVARQDYLVNLWQALLETLFFYHPAVWWLSNRVRVERENCCDDLAVESCGDAVLYARALSDLEQLRRVKAGPALAVNGGSLLSRVKRLLGVLERPGRGPRRWMGAAGLSLLTAALFASGLPSRALAGETLPRLDSKTAKARQTPAAPPAPPSTPAPQAIGEAEDDEDLPPRASSEHDERHRARTEPAREEDETGSSREDAEADVERDHAESEHANDCAERVRDREERLRERNQERARAIRERAQEIRERAQEQAESIREREQERMDARDEALQERAQENTNDDEPRASRSPGDLEFNVKELSRISRELGDKARKAIRLPELQAELKRLQGQLYAQAELLRSEAQRFSSHPRLPDADDDEADRPRLPTPPEAPRPPEPSEAAAPPAPPQVPTQRFSFDTDTHPSQVDVDRSVDGAQSISATGSIKLTRDGNGLEAKGPGTLLIRDRGDGTVRELRVDADAKGNLTQRFSRDGRAWTDEAETRAFFLSVLPKLRELLRR